MSAIKETSQPGTESGVEEILAYWIRRHRSEKGWTQRDLARLVGVSPAMIEHLENGRRWISVETIRALAKTFGCKTWELFRLPSSPPHFEQLTWLHAREVLDREFAQLEFVKSLPQDLLQGLIELANAKKHSAIEERLQMRPSEKKPEYQDKPKSQKRASREDVRGKV